MKPNWQDIATHDPANIKGFFGDYRFLSNFHVAPVEFEGMMFPSSENAYQAAKCAPNKRAPFQVCTPAVSKKLWKEVGTVYLPGDWDGIKYFVMSKILFEKFLRNNAERNALKLTGTRYLEETNYWGDVYWGVDPTKGGENNLGKLLMKTRAYFAA